MVRRIRARGKKKFLGNRTHGGGNVKNRRGKGNKGGVGRAGFHKHKRMLAIKLGLVRGEKGFVNPRRAAGRGRLKEINLAQIQAQIDAGKHGAAAPGADGVYSISLPGFKVLSSGVLKSRIAIRAARFSGKAKQKIVAAGGSAIE
ncbi:MAG: uL15m family ribosomal protein [Candidatus Norongarragalinales archaeon]